MANEPLFNPGIPAPVAEPVIEPIVETPAEVNAEVTPAVVEPVVEPVAEIPTELVVAETPTPTEVFKEVEKIVEKYPEMDDYTKEIFEALMAGKEETLLSYLSEKNRNYATMSDYDVVKANLLKSNPHYSPDDAELKMEIQYGAIAKIDLSKIDPDLNPDEYARAEAHNATADRNQKLLKLDAIEARSTLEASKKEIKLPKIPQVETPAQSNQPSAESIEQGRRDWEAIVDTEIPTLKELSFKVGSEKDGFEDVTYAITDKERTDELAFYKDLNLNKLLNRLNWVDANGKQNVAKMAGDVLKLERAQQLIASSYNQGKTAGTKNTVAEIKNIDLSTNNTTSVAGTPPDIGMAAWGHLNPK
jgi:hypothetical protein